MKVNRVANVHVLYREKFGEVPTKHACSSAATVGKGGELEALLQGAIEADEPNRDWRGIEGRFQSGPILLMEPRPL